MSTATATATATVPISANKDTQQHERNRQEAGHYVVTSHRASSVTNALRCSFLGPDTTDVIIVKACHLEIRQLSSSSSSSTVTFDGGDDYDDVIQPSFSEVLDLPIRGRISILLAFRPVYASTDFLFFATERQKYAVISFDPISKAIVTHDRGVLNDMSVRKEADCGPLATVDPGMNCIAIHIYDGLIKCFPILHYRPPPNNGNSKSLQQASFKHSSATSSRQAQQQQGTTVLGEPFNATIDQQTVLSMTFLYDTPTSILAGLLRLSVLCLDTRGFQQLITHVVDLKARTFRSCHDASNKGVTSGSNSKGPTAGTTAPVNSTVASTASAAFATNRLQSLNLQGPRKSRIDGGSCLIIPLPLLSIQAAASAATAASNKTSSTSANSDNITMTNSSIKYSGIGGGVIVVGQMQITHVSNSNGVAAKVLPIEPTIFHCFSPIPLPFSYGGNNANICSFRFLLGDDRGYLYVLDVSHDELSGIVTGLHMEILGVTTIPSSIVFLDTRSSLAYIASRFGDSLLIKLHPERDPHTNSHVEIVEEYTNLGPIVDFDVVDFDGKGQCQVVTCSGAGKDGSIRVVRNGIGIQEKANVVIPGIKGMWNLRAYFHDDFDKYIVQSFINETRILAICDDEMEETSIEGFISETATLFASNVAPNFFVQVTERKIVLVDCETFLERCNWVPPDNSSCITVASGNCSGQLVIALRGGVVIYLTLDRREMGGFFFNVQATTKLDQEVSCINLNPFVENYNSCSEKSNSSMMDIDNECTSANMSLRSKIVVVGVWNDFSVRMLDLDRSSGSSSLDEILRLDLGGDTQARSLILATLEGTQRMLLIGLGDGQLISYFLQEAQGKITVSSRKKVSIGTQSISLCAFRNASHGNTCIFSSGDIPTVVYMNGGKLLYSNINLSTDSGRGAEEVVNWVCPFHCELFPDCLCLASEETLRIGTIDAIQKLHVQTFPMRDTPKRVAHHKIGRLFVVGAICNGLGGVFGKQDQGEILYFLDDTSFEEIHSVQLEPFEQVLSVVSCNLQNNAEKSLIKGMNSFILVGTAYALPDEDEPTKGRILVFETSTCSSVAVSLNDANSSSLSRSVRQLTEYYTNGAVYSMCPFCEGSIMASVNSTCHIFRWYDADGVAELTPDAASHFGHILSLFVKSQKNVVLVGDIMRSIAVLQYEDNCLEEVARDYNSNWLTAIEILSEHVYLGAENWSNLFILRRNVDAVLEEVRCRLDTQGEFYLGEMINKFARGSLVMRTGDEGNSLVSVGSKTLYGTVDGSIGCVIGLSVSDFAFFRCLESCLASEIVSIGGFSHQEFRAFVAERRIHPSRGFVDGDLIESFLDLSRNRMETVVSKMNESGGWDVSDDSHELMSDQTQVKTLTVEQVLMRVEEMSRLH